MKNIIGQIFGGITILDEAEPIYDKNGRKSLACKVQCNSCGDVFTTRKGSAIKNKKGCKSCASGLENLKGQKFGRLTVLRKGKAKVMPSGARETRWWCQCDCGSPEKLIYSRYLKAGNTKSCGCYTSELTIEFNKRTKKKYNTYDLESEEYGIGWTNKGQPFFFDKEDFDKIKNNCWCISEGYVIDRNGTKFHRIVLGLEDDDERVPDHIHGRETRNDNRKCNLRIATNQQNGVNRGLLPSNKSGVTGVCYDKEKNMWCAYIGYNYKHIFLGSFVEKENAILARKKAEEKYFGEFSYDNSQNIEYENPNEKYHQIEKGS